MGKRKAQIDTPTKLRPDMAETAFRVMQEATGQTEKTRPGEQGPNPEAASKGARGGVSGGKVRAKRLTAKERTAAAKKAAAARWDKTNE